MSTTRDWTERQLKEAVEASERGDRIANWICTVLLAIGLYLMAWAVRGMLA